MSKKVSVLVPIYNTSAFIEKCATSLFEQTFKDIEYIFINDCTPDDSIDKLNRIIARYPGKDIKIINHTQNLGLSGARNTGVSHATGDYILHVDSDDYIEQTMIEHLYNKAREDNADIVVCDYILKWQNIEKKVFQGYKANKEDFLRGLIENHYQMCLWNKLIRTSLYKDNNISCPKNINFAEDYLVFIPLVIHAHKISKVNQFLYYYVQFNSNAYTKKFSIKSLHDFIDSRLIMDDILSSSGLYEEYKREIRNGKLLTILHLLSRVDESQYEYLFSAFNDLDKADAKLNLHQKILKFLFLKKQKQLIKIYCSFYNGLFRLIQKIKRR